jgi:hypothetical protein
MPAFVDILPSSISISIFFSRGVLVLSCFHANVCGIEKRKRKKEKKEKKKTRHVHSGGVSVRSVSAAPVDDVAAGGHREGVWHVGRDGAGHIRAGSERECLAGGGRRVECARNVVL